MLPILQYPHPLGTIQPRTLCHLPEFHPPQFTSIWHEPIQKLSADMP